MVEVREIFSESAKAAALGITGFTAWSVVKSLGISPTISPISLGVAAAVFSATKKISEQLFQKFFSVTPKVQADPHSFCYYVIQLSAATASVLTIYVLGIFSLSLYTAGAVFTAKAALELMFFLKTLEFLHPKTDNIIQGIENFLTNRFPSLKKYLQSSPYPKNDNPIPNSPQVPSPDAKEETSK